MAQVVFEVRSRNSGLEFLGVSFADADWPEILTALTELAPVVAVRGNMDTFEWARTLPETAVAEAGKILLYVLHDVHALDLNPAAAGAPGTFAGSKSC